MTKRDFDRETKINFGTRMASDERAGYRTDRMREHNGSGAHVPTRTRASLIDRRAAWNRERNAYRVIDGERVAVNRDGFLPVLALGSQWRTIASYAKRTGRPLLG